MAREKPGQTLQATALVHEAYLRLVDTQGAGAWNSRGHFFAAAAEAMRRILVNRARDKRRLKRGGDRERIELGDVAIADEAGRPDILALDEALDGLAREEPVCARSGTGRPEVFFPVHGPAGSSSSPRDWRSQARANSQ